MLYQFCWALCILDAAMDYSLRYLLFEINQMLPSEQKVIMKPPINDANRVASIRILSGNDNLEAGFLYFDIGLRSRPCTPEGSIVVTIPSRSHLFKDCALALVDEDALMHLGTDRLEDDPIRAGLIYMFNELSNLMATLSQLVEESYEIMSKDANLQRLIERVSAFEENPMWICDSSQKMLAYYDPGSYRETSPLWNHLIKYGYHVYTLMDKLNITGELKSMKRAGDACYMEPENFPNRYISKSIYYDGKYYGNFFIIQYSSLLTERDLEIANHIGTVLENSQFTNQYAHFDGVNGIRFIEDLIEGKPIEKKFIQEQLDLLGWTMRSEYTIFCINTTSMSDSLKKQLVTLLRSDGLVHCLNYRDETIVLVNCNDTPLDQAEMRIDRYVRYFHLQAGVSERFFDFESIKAYYEQANYCAKLPLDGKSIFVRYEDYFFKHLHTIASNSLADFAPLTILDEYDSLNAGELRLTLHTWLILNGNTTLVGRKMHVHRNTIIARLKKIKELLDIDLDSFEIRMRLLYALEDNKE